MWYSKVSFWLLTLSVKFLPKISKSVHICQSYSKPKVGRFFETRCRYAPDDLEEPVRNDEHLSCDFALATDEVSRREDVRSHLEHEVVQKLRLTFVKYRHLLSTRMKPYQMCTLTRMPEAEFLSTGPHCVCSINSYMYNTCKYMCTNVRKCIPATTTVNIYINNKKITSIKSMTASGFEFLQSLQLGHGVVNN